MERLHHLRTKTVPWHQDTRPRSATHRAKHPRVKKEAIKKSLGHKRMLHRCSHCHVGIACSGRAMHHLPRRREGTKIKLHLFGVPR